MRRDLFMNADLKAVATTTMGLVDAVQERPNHEQLAAFGAAFLLLVEQSGMPLPDVMAAVKNMMNHADGKRPEFKAVEAYMQNELFGR
ncbi:hypothetical protein [Desulfovibrio oxyclinae]|uniref:hypothetical protein n=1 Tax=Desulfovibrio oxyclinae TaxID=63560 RepID=UPI000370B452|nr:hypothetical protein [Desulfovibrio oxyclinae]